MFCLVRYVCQAKMFCDQQMCALITSFVKLASGLNWLIGTNNKQSSMNWPSTVSTGKTVCRLHKVSMDTTYPYGVIGSDLGPAFTQLLVVGEDTKPAHHL